MKRRFYADEVLHIYQRTVSGFNIFYSTEDFLVFYTIISVYARRYGITLLGLCQMIDHIHLLGSSSDLQSMSRFISASTSQYVKEFNKKTGRTGRLFEKEYLTDWIIKLYFPFDVRKVTSYYRSHTEMLIAINSNTGSEHDIIEHSYCKTDVPYREMMVILKKTGLADIKSVIMWPEEDKKRLEQFLKSKTSAT